MTDSSVRAELMQVRATVAGRAVAEDLDAIAAVAKSDLEGLNAACIAHGGKFAWWSVLEMHALDDEQGAKDALEAYEADALSLSADDETVTKAKARMRTAAEWRLLRDAHRAAQRTTAMMRVGRKTVEEHKDGLRQACENMRSEMASRLSVYGQAPVAARASAELARSRERRG